MDAQERLHLLSMYYSRFITAGKIKNKKQFAEILDVNYSTICSAFNGDERYLTMGLLKKINLVIKSLQLDGEMPLESEEEQQVPMTTQTIPVLPTSARAGTLADFADSVKSYECERIISPIKGADYAMQVTGDSMSPEYPNGSHILIKKINEEAFIPFGNVFVLDTCNGAVIKQVFPTDDPGVVECRSLNPLYPNFKVKTIDIYGWYRVLMCLSLK